MLNNKINLKDIEVLRIHPRIGICADCPKCGNSVGWNFEPEKMRDMIEELVEVGYVKLEVDNDCPSCGVAVSFNDNVGLDYLCK